jgi:prepilin-type N-terminal cleavage/methylation domain-containing protein
MTPFDIHRSCQTSRRHSNGERGFSMTELTIVISILGVLATISMTSFNHLLSGSKDAVAAERLELLNRALHTFAQQNYEMVFNRMDSGGADEMVILRTLQYRNTDIDRAKIGSPYVDPRYNPIVSTNAGDYRIRWTGRCYELLKPGTAGSGIRMNFDGTDFTTPFVFPPNFQMAGR